MKVHKFWVWGMGWIVNTLAALTVMRKRKVISIVLILIVVVAGLIFFASSPRIQVVGSLPAKDVAQIRKAVWKEIRFWVFPDFGWDDLHYPRYVFGCIKDYERLHILWIDVKPDRSVEVFVGENKATILSHGHVVDLRKQSDWQISGYAYWASSNVAPQNIHVPPSI
jgi:hypothetical protein